MPDPRLQALMIEFAGRVASLDPPPQIDVYDLVQFKAAAMDAMLLVMPSIDTSASEIGCGFSTSRFLQDAYNETARRSLPAKPPVFLTSDDHAVVSLVREAGTIKAAAIATRLGFSATSSHFRARLTNLAAQDVLISTHFGYRLGPSAPGETAVK